MTRLGLPLLYNLGWGLFALLWSKLFGLPLATLVYMAPDFGYTLWISGVVALGWSVLRTMLAFWVLRKRGATRAIGAPVMQ